MENRLRSGFDLYIPRPPGGSGSQSGTLLLWHHNMTDNTPGSQRPFDAIRVKAADNSLDSLSVLTDFFPANPMTNRQSLNDLTVPASTLGWRDSAWGMWFGNERPGNFAVNGIRRNQSGHTTIEYVAPSAVTTSVTPGWATMGVPVRSWNKAARAIFPTAESVVWAYVPGAGYVERDSLEAGEGYFVRLGPTPDMSFGGTLIDSLAIPVAGEWNLIGSISDRIPLANICLYPYPSNQITSPVYRFVEGANYVPVDSIAPGYGYWVKVAETGTLVMKRFASPCLTVPELDVSWMDRFEVSDARGRTQNLYVANIEVDPSISRIDLSMPPRFPEPAFDARFARGEFVKTVSAEDGVVELMIVVETDSYPVTITWDLNPANGMKYEIVKDGLRKPSPGAALTRAGSTTITNSSGGRLRLDAQAGVGTGKGVLPTEYLLAQNYPNPFNPQTEIHYELPSESHVRLVVYDLLGREVATLVDEVKEAGRYDATLNASGLASGVYFYRLQAGSFNGVKKLVVLR